MRVGGPGPGQRRESRLAVLSNCATLSDANVAQFPREGADRQAVGQASLISRRQP